MKKNFICIIVLFFSVTFYGQGVTGKWNTIDDETGKVISVVEIFEKNHKIYGKVIQIFNPKSRNRVCENCSGEDKNKPILGLVVIKGLQKEGDEYRNGKILDPKSGKLYKCYITLINPDKLKVRGFIGISLLGRTQHWERVKVK